MVLDTTYLKNLLGAQTFFNAVLVFILIIVVTTLISFLIIYFNKKRNSQPMIDIETNDFNKNDATIANKQLVKTLKEVIQIENEKSQKFLDYMHQQQQQQNQQQEHFQLEEEERDASVFDEKKPKRFFNLKSFFNRNQDTDLNCSKTKSNAKRLSSRNQLYFNESILNKKSDPDSINSNFSFESIGSESDKESNDSNGSIYRDIKLNDNKKKLKINSNQRENSLVNEESDQIEKPESISFEFERANTIRNLQYMKKKRYPWKPSKTTLETIEENSSVFSINPNETTMTRNESLKHSRKDITFMPSCDSVSSLESKNVIESDDSGYESSSSKSSGSPVNSVQKNSSTELVKSNDVRLSFTKNSLNKKLPEDSVIFQEFETEVNKTKSNFSYESNWTTQTELREKIDLIKNNTSLYEKDLTTDSSTDLMINSAKLNDRYDPNHDIKMNSNENNLFYNFRMESLTSLTQVNDHLNLHHDMLNDQTSKISFKKVNLTTDEELRLKNTEKHLDDKYSIKTKEFKLKNDQKLHYDESISEFMPGFNELKEKYDFRQFDFGYDSESENSESSGDERFHNIKTVKLNNKSRSKSLSSGSLEDLDINELDSDLKIKTISSPQKLMKYQQRQKQNKSEEQTILVSIEGNLEFK